MTDLLALNENQRKAVTWKDGPILVLAGPGSGKTHVLTSRIVKLLEESQDQHFRILALTFTNKAATEMRLRIKSLAPTELNRVRLTTFHSFASELLQHHGEHIVIRPDFSILTSDSDRLSIIKDIINYLNYDQQLGFSDTYLNPTKLLKIINIIIENGIMTKDSQSFIGFRGIENPEIVNQVYLSYMNSLHSLNCLDYPSLLLYSCHLLKQYPAIAIHIRKLYTHILVDEFQDTNGLQYEFLTLLVNPNPSTLFVVADDDDQIIYQWNGANPGILRNLVKKYSLNVLQLPENYRCPQKVIGMANSLIGNNLDRSFEKMPLISLKVGENCDTVRCLSFGSINEEASWIAKDMADRNNSISTIAVLARTRKTVKLVGNALAVIGITPYYAERKDEFETFPLQILHSTLRLINSPEDKKSLNRFIGSFAKYSGILLDLDTIYSYASLNGDNYMQACLAEIAKANCSQPVIKLMTLVKELILTLNYKDFIANFFSNIEITLKTNGFDRDFIAEYGIEVDIWKELQEEIARKFSPDNLSLYQFLQEFDLNAKVAPKKPGSIPCFTIHGSKGLEFDHVYVMGLVDGLLPSWQALNHGENSSELQEERRNCFVAITRAKKSLTLTFSKIVDNYPKKPSCFLREMGYDV
jgi:DNA helicase-2/ATP-dependent DNA helicase PcrA